MNENRYQELKPLLGPGERGLILIHPDPDSLASAWALSMLFSKNGSSADVAAYESIKRIENKTMVKLLAIPLKNFKDLDRKSYTRWCMVDAQPNQFPDVIIPEWHVLMDHHPVQPECNCRFTDIRPDTGATSTIMTEYLTNARVRINEKLATALCYGIITDTDRFQRSMTKNDAEAFSGLFTRANYRILRLIEQTEIPLRQLHYFDYALRRLQVKKRRVVIHIGAAEAPDIAVILADFFIRVSGIQFVVVSVIAHEKLVIIFRSRNLNRDAGKIADRNFSQIGSAGGHKSAARAEIPLGQLPPSVKLYNPESVEQFIEKSLSMPGKRSRQDQPAVKAEKQG